MRPITLNTGFSRPDFDALLASRQFGMAEVFTIDLVDGSSLYYTNNQQTFTVPPVDGTAMLRTYAADQVQIDGLRFKIDNGSSRGGGEPTTQLSVDEQTVTFTPQASAAIAGVPFIAAVGAGVLDGAKIRRDRWFMDRSIGVAVGGTPLFYGLASSLEDLGRSAVRMKVKSDLVLLNIQMPRNLYQPSCIFTVYSPGCGANEGSFAQAGAVGAAPSRTVIPWAGAGPEFRLGTITFGSGVNTNVKRSIRAASGSSLTLAYPLPYAPAPGDLFSASPGCDRQYAGDCVFFGRQAAFRGYKFVPQAQTAV